MRVFAQIVIKFLEETYKDAYAYHFEFDPCANWQECLELYVSDKTFRIRINKHKIFELYKMYCNGYDTNWQEQLMELIDN